MDLIHLLVSIAILVYTLSGSDSFQLGNWLPESVQAIFRLAVSPVSENAPVIEDDYETFDKPGRFKRYSSIPQWKKDRMVSKVTDPPYFKPNPAWRPTPFVPIPRTVPPPPPPPPPAATPDPNKPPPPPEQSRPADIPKPTAAPPAVTVAPAATPPTKPTNKPGWLTSTVSS